MRYSVAEDSSPNLALCPCYGQEEKRATDDADPEGGHTLGSGGEHGNRSVCMNEFVISLKLCLDMLQMVCIEPGWH